MKQNMTSIEISKLKLTPKSYLKNFLTYQFESLLLLIFELFESYQHGQKEIIEIEALLEEIGYSNLKEIPIYEIETIRTIVKSKLEEWERQEDSEYLSYKLMAAIQAKNIIVFVDNILIEDVEKPISITPDSIITFINKLKIGSISFKTL